MTVAVVGSGEAGLACAEALGECLVLERLPVPGGEEWEHLAHAVARCDRARFLTATQAIRWDGRILETVGFHGGAYACDAVVIATGHRPATRAELGIAGPRVEGILPATVALHLLHHGGTIGERPVVTGGGRLAEQTLAALPGAIAIPGVQAVRGAGRIEAVETGGETIACDALVLAGTLPYRNVDGAIDEGPGVVFADGEDRIEAGRRAAARARALGPSGRIEPVLRIGPPA